MNLVAVKLTVFSCSGLNVESLSQLETKIIVAMKAIAKFKKFFIVNQCILLKLYAYEKGSTASDKQQCWKQFPICLLTTWLLECLQGSTVN